MTKLRWGKRFGPDCKVTGKAGWPWKWRKPKHKRKPGPFDADRVCAVPGCETVLSRYNEGPCCNAHKQAQ